MWGGGGGKSVESTGSTPFAEAAGFATSGGTQASGGSSRAKAEGRGGYSKAKDEAKPHQGQRKTGESKDSAGKAGLIAADAAANLAKGTAQVAKEKMASIKEGATDRIAETLGGKIAAAIKAGNAQDQTGATIESVPTFEGNNLAGAGTSDVDAAAEVAAFANRDTKSA
jgi:hypothetical protein